MVWHVPSLSLPNIKKLPGFDELSQYEALRLFAERATLALPHFTITKENVAAIAQICQRLDGIPLALELAAARVNVLKVEQIAARLADTFRLLTGGNRTALPRQQTLQATIDWSYNLLIEKERALLGRLSVFAGGWTLEAAKPYLDKADAPVIIIITSNHSLYTIPNSFPYNVAKTGLVAMVQSLAIEWGPHLRAVGVAPGFIDTPLAI